MCVAILYRLKGYKDFTPIPTSEPSSSTPPLLLSQPSPCIIVGCNIETISYKNLDFNVRDFGGGEKLRAIWHCYYHSGTQVIIFVVDCTDRERIDEARTELHENILSDHDLMGLPVLVYANKQDAPKAMSSDEVIEKLKMRDLKGTSWHVQPRYVSSS